MVSGKESRNWIFFIPVFVLLHLADIIFIILAESDCLFRDALVPRRQPSTRLQALVGENQNAWSAACSPSKPEDYHVESTPFSPFWTRSWPKLRIGSVEK